MYTTYQRKRRLVLSNDRHPQAMKALLMFQILVARRAHLSISIVRIFITWQRPESDRFTYVEINSLGCDPFLLGSLLQRPGEPLTPEHPSSARSW